MEANGGSPEFAVNIERGISYKPCIIVLSLSHENGRDKKGGATKQKQKKGRFHITMERR
jgi:hypothetical protein